MNVKTTFSILVLALTTHSVLADTSRDGSSREVNVNNQDVEHVRSTENYAPQLVLPLTEVQATEIRVNSSADAAVPAMSTLSTFSAFNTMSNVEEGCSEQVFTSLSGTGLLAALRSSGRDCVDKLFNDEPETLALGAYSDANLATVVNEIKAQALTYNGTDADEYLSAMFYWLKAYAFYDERRFVNPQSQQMMEQAVNALYASSHFFDKNAQNGLVVRSALGILKNANIAERFIHITRDVLNRYDESYENVSNWGAAVSPLFWQSLQSCSSSATCRAQEHNSALINSIKGFINNNISWLDKPDNDYHLFNLGYQLVNLYRGESEAHFAAIEDELVVQIDRILNTSYGPLKTDPARTLYLAVYESVNYNGVCAEFNACNLKDELIAQVLSDRMTCPSGNLFIWAQDMDQAQLEWTCSSLGEHENYFHDTLRTNRTPVTPDDNDKLHMIIFNDKKEWVTYGGALFNVSTNNGGTYREGDPSLAGDQATFYAYEDVGERPIFDVWNLRHEYIHYLEGRFISKGSFRDSDSAGRTVWFGEGIAEYISLRDCNAGAIDEARSGDYALSTIFSNEYGVGQTRIYDWGYLSNRYMFERQNAQFFSMLALFKQGDFQAYREDLVDPWVNNRTYDADFANWLTSVESTGCTIDSTRPASPEEAINVDDVQGNDQVGINACTLGREQQEFSIQPGVATCLSAANAGKMTEYALSVPQGLADASLQITLRHGTGNADLYQEHGSANNGSSYELESTGANNNETILVVPVKSGWNYVGVKAQSDFADVTLLARFIQNGEPIDDNELQNAISKMASGAKGEDVHFTLTVPADSTRLSFDIEGGSGDADLYVKFGSAPSLTNYDCRPYKGGNKEHCEVSNVQAGTYYVMLHGYSEFSDVEVMATYSYDNDNADASVLENGVAKLVSGTQGSEVSYSMVVPAGATNLSFNTSGGSGDADLHVKFGSEATQANYDCRPWKNGSTERCSINNVQAGTYYIMLLGHNDFSGVSLVGSYTP